MLPRSNHVNVHLKPVWVALALLPLLTGNCTTFSSVQDPGEGVTGGSTGDGGNGGTSWGGSGGLGGAGSAGKASGGTGGGSGGLAGASGTATGGMGTGGAAGINSGGTNIGGTGGASTGGTAGKSTGGSSGGGAAGTATGGAAGAVPGSPVDLCLKALNVHRAASGVPDFKRWAAGEPCASDAAEDVAKGSAFDLGACGASAGTICPDWTGPPETMIAKCIDYIWGQGGQGHDHIASASYTEVACGFFVNGASKVWAAQAFR